MMMKMMKMMMVLVLSCVLRVSAEGLHEDFQIVGCSQTDGEQMYSLDQEELVFMDFKNKKAVDAQPPFVDHVSIPGAYEQAVANQQICRQNLNVNLKAFKDLPLEKDSPSSPIIYPKDFVEPGQKNELVCFVTGFFPAPVNISWTKNGRIVTEGTSSNVPFPNKDGSFNQFSRLEFVPQQGDIYTCSVEHLSLQEPLTRMWDVEVEQGGGVGPAVFCGLGLTLGLLGVAAGTFFLIKGNECS